jgi:hypothetical protein
VAATGFLPGVLSFLCALSHLERVAHRPNNLFFQLQPPLSPGESVVQTGQQATRSPALRDHNNQWGKQTRAFQTGSTMTGWSHGYGFGTETPHTGSICSDRGCIGFSRNQHRLSPKSTHRLRPPVSEWHEVSCRGRTGRTVHTLQRSDRFTLRGRVEWRRNPQHGSSQPFYLHGLGLTLVTHETACIPSACVPSIWKLLVLPKRT